MNRLLVAAAIVALAAFLLLRTGGAAAPPQVARATPRESRLPARPARAAETLMPPRMLDTKQQAYGEAVARRSDSPGHEAFRRMSDRFVRHNLDAARAQATAEGLTLDEVRELTYFGQVVQHTQRWGEVEAILGRAVTADEMEQASTLMHQLDAEFTRRMREAVAARADLAGRRPLIAELEARYESEYLAITGMTAEQLDDLLVADIARTRRN